jgi:mannose-6-phosphate isomerase-like protein (cupin superfamily)
LKNKDFDRPWGGFIKFTDNFPSTVKILFIKKGASLSLQSHKLRREFWYVIQGKIKITIGKNLKTLKKKNLREGEKIEIPKRYIHRIEGIEKSKVLEISIGRFKEEDITRIKDRYGRI